VQQIISKEGPHRSEREEEFLQVRKRRVVLSPTVLLAVFPADGQAYNIRSCSWWRWRSGRRLGFPGYFMSLAVKVAGLEALCLPVKTMQTSMGCVPAFHTSGVS
jgi:hypothetical protein